MISFFLFPPLRCQLIEKFLEAGDFDSDPLNLINTTDTIESDEKILNFMDKNTTPDFIQCLERLSESATSGHCKTGESMILYIKRFLLLAQTYLNTVSAVWEFADSQNLAMIFLSNENLSAQLFSSVMSSLFLQRNINKVILHGIYHFR